MEFGKGKRNLAVIASATAVVCLVVLVFFRTSIFVGAARRVVHILEPFLYGGAIAYLLRPICRIVERWLRKVFHPAEGSPWEGRIRMLSILLALVLLFLVLILLLLAVLPELLSSITGLVRQMPQAVTRFETWLASLDTGELTHEAVSYVQTTLDTATEYLQNFLQSDVLPHLQKMVTGVTSGFRGFLGVLKNFGLGCIISAYFLGNWEKFTAQAKLVVYSLLPRRAADWVRREVHFTDRMFSGFIHGKVLDSLIIGVICFLFTTIVRMPYAMLVSVIVGVTNIVPFFGPYLGAIPSAVLILTVSPTKCVLFLVFIIVLQQIDGNVLGPMILGDRLGLSGFWILFSILFFGSLFGVMGMLVGAPLFAVLYDILREWVMHSLHRRGEDAMVRDYGEQFEKKEKPAEKKS